MGVRVETEFKLMSIYSKNMINYQLFQKLKLVENGKVNNLTIFLTAI